jgi:hypothetical protein
MKDFAEDTRRNDAHCGIMFKRARSSNACNNAILEKRFDETRKST